MKSKSYFGVTSFLFAVIAFAHLLRLFYHWRVQFGSVLVPVWISWVAMIVLGYLAYTGYKLRSK